MIVGLIVSVEVHPFIEIEKKYEPGVKLLIIPIDVLPDNIPVGLPIIVQLSGEGRFTKETLPVLFGQMGCVTTSMFGGEGVVVTFTVMIAEVELLHVLLETRT